MKSIFMRALALVMSAMLLFVSCGFAASADKILGEGVSTSERGAASTYSGASAIYNKSEWKVLALTNATRLSMGIPAMTMFSGIQNACDLRENELTQLFSHTRPDGRSCFSALDDCGVPYTGAAENIAAGYDTPASVVDGWLGSPGHRANMLNPSNTHMGVGYLKSSAGGYYWVQLFSSWYSETTLGISLEGAENLTVKRGQKIADMGITLHETNSVYGDCVSPLIDEMCTGYNPNLLGIQNVTARFNGFEASFAVNVVEPVTKVTFNKTSAKLLLGKSLQLTAKIYPETANIRTLEWKSSDESVATVDANGLVTTVGKGKCTITATAHSGVKATCSLEVTIKEITSIKLDRTSYSVTLKKGDALGETFTLSATIKPKNASIKKLKWKSSDTDVATVDENGTVTIVGFGKCTITAKATDGSKKTASCAINVGKKTVTKITLAGENAMKVGDTQTLSAAVKPKKAFDQSLRWKSSNPAFAAVDENGTVVALKKGTVTITCTARDGSKVKAKFKIKVINGYLRPEGL